MKRWGDWQIACFLFVELWVTYSFIGPGWSWGLRSGNVITRMGLVFSILDNHSLSLGDFAVLTTDKALVNGAYFADKAPGLSFMALPVIAVLKWIASALGFSTAPIVDGNLSPFFWVSTTIACALTTALLTALSAAMLFLAARIALGASRGAAIFGALVYGLATPMAGWATVFFGHAVAGACLIIAFSLTLMVQANATPWRDRAMGGFIGLLLGWTVVVELTSAPAAAIIALFALTRLKDVERPRRLQLLLSAVGGGVIAALPFVAYNQLAFGSPVHFGYENVVGFEGMKSGFLGVSAPNWSVLWEIIFGRYRGILWISPILALVPVSYWIAARRLPLGVTAVLLAVPLCYLWINSGYYYWDGGASTGPRHITPSLGFLALTFVPLWDHLPSRISRLPLAAVGVGSAAIVLVCALVMMTVPEITSPIHSADPLMELILPFFLLGCIHDVAVSIAMTCTPATGFHNNLPTLLWLPLLWVGSAVTLTTLFTRLPSLRRERSSPTDSHDFGVDREPAGAWHDPVLSIYEFRKPLSVSWRPGLRPQPLANEMQPPMSRALVRYSLPIAGFCIFAAFAALYVYAPHLYAEILTGIGLAPFRYPFLDGQYALAGAKCWHLGINVYVNDPCDVLDRAHNYSPLWLRLPVIPMSMTIPLGIGLTVIFILSLAVVAPVRRGREFGLGLLAATSPMVLFALERANLDLVVFLLVVTAGLAWPRLSGGWRLLAYGPPLLAGLLKYYPLTLLCLPLRERPRAFLVTTAASLGAVAVFLAAFHGEVLASLHNIPGGGYTTGMFGANNPAGAYFADNFGAPILLGGITQLIASVTAVPAAAAPGLLLISIVATMALLTVVPAIRIARAPATRASIAQLSPRQSFFLTSGAALIAGCFFAGQSLNYRGVHLLLVLPAFLALSERQEDQQDRSRFWRASVVIVFLMWGDCLRTWVSGDGLMLVRLGLWLIRELLWWWLVGNLVGALLCFALESPLFQGFGERLGGGHATGANASSG